MRNYRAIRLSLPVRVSRRAGTLVFLAILTAAAAPAAALERLPYGEGLLWRVERPGTAPSHLFGTIHSNDPRVTAVPPAVSKALGAARSLTVEVVKTKDMPIRMARRMMLPPDRTLDDVLGGQLFTRLVAVAGRFGLPETTLRRLKPWAAGAAISTPPEERAGELAGRPVLDHALQRAASVRGIPVHGLETIEEQLALMDDLPLNTQILLLKQAVEDSAKLASYVETIKRFYLARDLSGLFAWMKQQAAGNDPRLNEVFEQRMINARNRIMADRMTPRLDEGGAFVAVGAAHLPGEEGVLSLLADKGYRLARVY